MKYWTDDWQKLNNVAPNEVAIGMLADGEGSVVALEWEGESVLIVEDRDGWNSRRLTPAEAIEALREAIAWIEERARADSRP